ncbi:MAG: hypothetical protein HY718_18035 [Planctomycetes bacterium]|nr:hypothetical protein [Planctomycetota bacterium]
MSENVPALESQVDEMLGALAADIDRVPPPSPAVIERVKAAVRHEMNERWLAGRAAPSPRPGLLPDIREAVRQAIDTEVPTGPRRWWRHPQFVAGLAAAAMVALGVGVVWRVGTWTTPARLDEPFADAAATHIDLFVEAAQVTLADDEFSSQVLKELQSIEQQLSTSQTHSTGDSVLNDLGGALEEFMESARPKGSTRGGPARSQGVYG